MFRLQWMKCNHFERRMLPAGSMRCFSLFSLSFKVLISLISLFWLLSDLISHFFLFFFLSQKRELKQCTHILLHLMNMLIKSRCFDCARQNINHGTINGEKETSQNKNLFVDEFIASIWFYSMTISLYTYSSSWGTANNREKKATQTEKIIQ